MHILLDVANLHALQKQYFQESLFKNHESVIIQPSDFCIACCNELFRCYEEKFYNNFIEAFMWTDWQRKHNYAFYDNEQLYAYYYELHCEFVINDVRCQMEMLTTARTPEDTNIAARNVNAQESAYKWYHVEPIAYCVAFYNDVLYGQGCFDCEFSDSFDEVKSYLDYADNGNYVRIFAVISFNKDLQNCKREHDFNKLRKFGISEPSSADSVYGVELFNSKKNYKEGKS